VVCYSQVYFSYLMRHAWWAVVTRTRVNEWGDHGIIRNITTTIIITIIIITI
jgi:hypothetical protein